MKKLNYLFILLFSVNTLFAQTDFKLKISGEIAAPMELSLSDLAKMPHTTAILKDKQGNPHTYSGVPILDIITKVNQNPVKEVHEVGFSKYILVKCADGYQVLFSLAELDKDFTEKNVIVADSVDGQPLPESKGSLRIVVEGEKKPARSSYQVVELLLGSVRK